MRSGSILGRQKVQILRDNGVVKLGMWQRFFDIGCKAIAEFHDWLKIGTVDGYDWLWGEKL